MATNLFEQAKKTSTVKSTKKPAKQEISMDQLEQLAELDYLIKTMTAMQKTIAADVKTDMHDVFLNAGMSQGRRPENYTGIDGNAIASCELRKRSTRSMLTETEIELLNKHDIPTQTAVSVAEAYVINPDYSKDSKLLKRVSKAISGVKNVPEDFIQLQEEVSATVVSDDAMHDIFKIKDHDSVQELLSIVGVMAIKPKLQNANVDSIIEHVKNMLI